MTSLQTYVWKCNFKFCNLLSYVNFQDNYTALHIAVESAKPAVVETLLGYGADVHVRGGRLRETPLHIAARVKDGDRCALMLLKSGAGANLTTDDGQTPVHVIFLNLFGIQHSISQTNSIF